MLGEIHSSWGEYLNPELKKDYMIKLQSFLRAELDQNKIIYPEFSEIFSAFNTTPFDQTKAVILGQDPYHGPNQAHGLSFSVRKNLKIPPSLRNIYQELNSDINLEIPKHGCLKSWAQNGVLLLNSVLSVRKGEAGSHQKKGWELFTDKAIKILNEEKKNLVFLLWGSPAQKKAAFLDDKKHLVLKCPHPSPLSAYRGFFGCRHFSKANSYLKENKIPIIDWSIS